MFEWLYFGATSDDSNYMPISWKSMKAFSLTKVYNFYVETDNPRMELFYNTPDMKKYKMVKYLYID